MQSISSQKALLPRPSLGPEPVVNTCIPKWQTGRSISSAADLDPTRKTIHNQYIHGKHELSALLAGNIQRLNNFKSIPEGRLLSVNSLPGKMLEFHNSGAKKMANPLQLNDNSSFWGAPAPLTMLPAEEQAYDTRQTLERIVALL